MASESSKKLAVKQSKPVYQVELLELFDVLVDVIFCVKDRDGIYVDVNTAFVRRTGRKSKREVLGHRAADFFPAELAERYEEQDNHVFVTGKHLRDELELIQRVDNTLGWYSTTKIPVKSDGESIDYLVSASHDLKIPSEESIGVESLGRVVQWVAKNLDRKIRVSDLARIAGCSPGQLERRMKRVFGISAAQYVLRCRVDYAVQLLGDSDLNLTDVAFTCGFYDQADLTRHFARMAGTTPARFRQQLVSSTNHDPGS